jgi:hypothetical protein
MNQVLLPQRCFRPTGRLLARVRFELLSLPS